MKYVCTICGYVYDEEKEKVPFKDLPDSWTCPLCGASKSAFVPLEDKKKEETKKPSKRAKLKSGNAGTVVTSSSVPRHRKSVRPMATLKASSNLTAKTINPPRLIKRAPNKELFSV